MFCLLQDLLAAGEKKWGTDESKFQVVIVSRSYAQLRATFQEYAKAANKDIEDTITSEMSGDIKNAMLAIGKKREINIIVNQLSFYTTSFDYWVTL